MNNGKIYVAGIGPGSKEDITPAVRTAIADSDVVIGYKYYFGFIQEIIGSHAKCVDTGMKKEQDRAAEAFRQAQNGKTVCVISSGDAGIYGMAPLILEMKKELNSDIEIEILPGISAFQKGAALLGAPIGHDFCIISLSDLMTPWEKIEKRIAAAAAADFVTAIYNPKSEGRYWQLHRLKEIFLEYRQPENPVGFVRQAGRTEQKTKITTLTDFDPEEVDMFTIVIIGNSQSYRVGQSHHHSPRLLSGSRIRHRDENRARNYDSKFPYHSLGIKEQGYTFGSEMGIITHDPYHSRFRYGKYLLLRSLSRGEIVPRFQGEKDPDNHYGCYDGRIGYPKRSSRTFRSIRKMLFA